MDQDIAFAPALEVQQLILNKQISPVELTNLYFNRIESLDSQLNSFLTLNKDGALDAARKAEQAVMSGQELGLLHGIPISIKDLEITKGIRTTSGSLVFENRVPNEDSVVVERIKRAGGIILGKTNTPEFGLLARTENRLGEPCNNPWLPERTAGGSSGGAAASVVAGLCSLATGTDGGGSIRIPASFCGVFGIKPTLGRVPYYSGGGGSSVVNLFTQAGPLSRTVRDGALLLKVLSGYDSRDPGSLQEPAENYLSAADQGIKGLRVAWSPDFGYGSVDEEVMEVTEKASLIFEALGCTLDEASLKLDSPFEVFWDLFSSISYARNHKLLEENRDELAEYTLASYEHGVSVTGADFAKGLAYINYLKSQFEAVFKDHDLLISPTMSVTPFPHGKPPTSIGGIDTHWFWGYLPFTYPINMIGYPAASIPCGFSEEGLPIGLHIIGPRFGEATILAASAAFEEAMPWIQRKPMVS